MLQVERKLVYPGDQQVLLTPQEMVELGAVDSMFFAETFFPKTMRQSSPMFHGKIWEKLDSTSRLVSLQVFRGGAKTSICRVFGAKRIAYGYSHTVLWVGKSQEHAIHSVKWLRKQIEYNRRFAETFQLRPGSKWQDVECEIIHGIDEYPITILALGVTGSVRGVNIDDYRPDLIILDDILDEENTSTPVQRKKTEDLVYGALKESLTPRSENPDAKMVMLQTPHNSDDVSMKSLKDSEWDSARFGIWTPETENLQLAEQESAWEIRHPTLEVRGEKQAAISRNQLSIFTREKECKIISQETSTFLARWLNYYDLSPPRNEMQIVMAIDPVPPPSEVELAKGLKGKDSEALTVVGRYKQDFYLLEYAVKTGHDPSWTIMEFFRLARKWRPQKIIVETIAYQRTLAWLLRRAMEAERQYFVIHENSDKRSKYTKIVDGLSGVASNGHLFCKVEHGDFIQQFTEYPDVQHEDVLETVAICCSALQGVMYEDTSEEASIENMLKEEEKTVKRLSDYRGAP